MHVRCPHRLPLDAYSMEGSAWHVTVCVLREIGSPFNDVALGSRMLVALESGMRKRGAVPHLICLMPDHVHMVIEVRTIGLVDLMARLKSESTQTWWQLGRTGKLWQKNFYDRGIRKSDDFDAIATYILHNPVRAGLVEEWRMYPLIAGEMIASG